MKSQLFVNTNVVTQIASSRSQPNGMFAVLFDPDSQDTLESAKRAEVCDAKGVDIILVGGTRVRVGSVRKIVEAIAKATDLPIVLVPGADSPAKIFTKDADAFFCPIIVGATSLKFLGGWHSKAVRYAKEMHLSSIPIGYVFIKSGGWTEVEQTAGLPVLERDSQSQAAWTAATAEMMGARAIYLEAGSGARLPVPKSTISQVREITKIPVIVGGGLRSVEAVAERVKVGADIIVVGNVLEENWDEFLLEEMVDAVHRTRKPVGVVDN